MASATSNVFWMWMGWRDTLHRFQLLLPNWSKVVNVVIVWHWTIGSRQVCVSLACCLDSLFKVYSRLTFPLQQTLSLAQNMDRQMWRPNGKGHVETEPKGWVPAFNTSISLSSLFERLLSWGKKMTSLLYCGLSTFILRVLTILCFFLQMISIPPPLLMPRKP